MSVLKSIRVRVDSYAGYNAISLDLMRRSPNKNGNPGVIIFNMGLGTSSLNTSFHADLESAKNIRDALTELLKEVKDGTSSEQPGAPEDSIKFDAGTDRGDAAAYGS